MKIECEVKSIDFDGESMTVGLSGRQKSDAEWRYDQPQSVKFTATEKMKRAFWLGRKVVVTVEPR